MADQIISRDANRTTVMAGVTDDSAQDIVQIPVDPTTGRILVSLTGSGIGTVTDVSVVSANGFAGTVATSTTTPAITLSTTITGLLKGNGTAISAATAGTDYANLTFKTIAVSGQSDIVADTAADTLTMVAGTGITLTTNAATDTLTITGTATTAPGGSNTQVQFNDSSAFGGDSKFTWNKASALLTVSGDVIATTTVTTPQIYGSSAANGDITIEGTSSATKTSSYIILQPTGGYVGIGNATPANKLDVMETKNNGGAYNMATVTYTSQSTVNGANTATGLNVTLNPVINAGVTDTGYGAGYIVNNLRNGSATLTNDSGTLTNLFGFIFQFGHFDRNAAETPLTTNVYGIHLDPYTKTGTITNMYDIYLDSATTGTGSVTNHWGFYQLNTSLSKGNYFGSKVGIGTTDTLTPQSLLDVSATTGGGLTLSRRDTTVTSGESIGLIQWWNNDTQLTTQNIYGNIEMQAAGNITADAAGGNMIFRTTSLTTLGGAPVEAFRLDSTQNAFLGLNSGNGSATLNIGLAGTTLGVLKLSGNTSGVGTIQVAAAAGTPTFVLPTVNRTGLTALPATTRPLLMSSTGVESTGSVTTKSVYLPVGVSDRFSNVTAGTLGGFVQLPSTNTASDAILWAWDLPSDYAGGTITATVHGYSPAGITTGTVFLLGVALGAFADGSSDAATFGTAQTLTTVPAASQNYIKTTAAITAAGSPAVGQTLGVQLYRDSTGGFPVTQWNGKFNVYGVTLTYTYTF